MLALLKQHSPTVEYYSIDEFFFDADYLTQSYQCDLPEAVAALQAEFLQQIGVPVSIGISTSRILAKLGSLYQRSFTSRYTFLPITLLYGLSSPFSP